MTDQNQQGLDWVPQACKLPTAQQPLRLAEFDAMFGKAVRDAERAGPQHLRVELRGHAGLEESVRDLTARETECCSFFTFTVFSSSPGAVTLDVEVPAEHTDVLDALQRRADMAREAV